jgi:hypothetical protein
MLSGVPTLRGELEDDIPSSKNKRDCEYPRMG